MNPKYDRYLVQKYVPLYQDRNKPMNETCMCWGFCCGSGWFNIINSLSSLLCNKWLRAKEDYDNIVGREGQLEFPDSHESKYNKIITKHMINEKAVALDYEYDQVPKAIQVKEKFGSLRFYVSAATDEQYAAITMAEMMSAVTCEDCGKPGKIKSIGGWYRCLCSDCRKKHLENLNKLYGVKT